MIAITHKKFKLGAKIIAYDTNQAPMRYGEITQINETDKTFIIEWSNGTKFKGNRWTGIKDCDLYTEGFGMYYAQEPKQCHIYGCKNEADEDEDLCLGHLENQSSNWLWGSDAP